MPVRGLGVDKHLAMVMFRSSIVQRLAMACCPRHLIRQCFPECFLHRWRQILYLTLILPIRLREGLIVEQVDKL
ncbi:hypothetical protein Micbo1qcDRAFT_168799, partial [Microdochium bolleyi]